jgi:hypothetical protein
VHHIPLPQNATLAHVQGLMESLPRPLTLNLFRPSPYDYNNYFYQLEDNNNYFNVMAKSDEHADDVLFKSVPVFSSPGVFRYKGGGSTDVNDPVNSADNNNNNNRDKLDEMNYRQRFFPSVIKAHKSYMLSEMHQREDPDTNRMEETRRFL